MTRNGEAEVLFEERGHAGVITLNRPEKLNAHTHEMALAIHRRLEEWALDDEIALVVIRGAGQRAFCAGGDVRTLWEMGRSDVAAMRRFYHDEYAMVACIHDYPKPVVALMHGHVMGGGAGLSVHASHRVAAESLSFAMPECSIGLFPDVGASWFLSRLPGALGLFLGLTGARIGADDAAAAGLVDAIVPFEAFDDIVEELAESEAVEAVIGHHARRPRLAPLAMMGPLVDTHFGRAGVEEIMASLRAAGGTWAEDALARMRRNSPTSMKVTFRQLSVGRGLAFSDCMKMEYRLAWRMGPAHDFLEGVRARIIDKDDAPRWRPERLREVDDTRIERLFAPLERELTLPQDM